MKKATFGLSFFVFVQSSITLFFHFCIVKPVFIILKPKDKISKIKLKNREGKKYKTLIISTIC